MRTAPLEAGYTQLQALQYQLPGRLAMIVRNRDKADANRIGRQRAGLVQTSQCVCEIDQVTGFGPFGGARFAVLPGVSFQNRVVEKEAKAAGEMRIVYRRGR